MDNDWKKCYFVKERENTCFDVLKDFVEGLARLEAMRDVNLHIVMSLREDYLGRWTDLLRRHPRLIRHTWRLPRLSVGEMSAAVLQGADTATQDLDLWFESPDTPELSRAAVLAGGFYAARMQPPMVGGTGLYMRAVVDGLDPGGALDGR